MRATLAVSLAVVAILGAISAAGAAGSLSSEPSSLRPAEDTGQLAAEMTASSASNGTNASMGAEMSAFMQASATDANASVDEGMFAAQWNQSNASAEALVEQRTNVLQNRLDALERQKERLLAKKDQMSDVAYKARMSALASRIDAIQAAVNSTETRAANAGVSTTQLDELRNRSNDLTGPEIAAVARNLSVSIGGGQPAGVPGGGPGGDPPGQNNSTPGNDGPGADDNSSNVDSPGADNPGSGNGSTNESDGPGVGGDAPGNGNDDDDGSDGGSGSGGGQGGENGIVLGATTASTYAPLIVAPFDADLPL